VVGLLEEMRQDFDSPEAEAAVADISEFVVLQTLLVTRETVMLDPGERELSARQASWPDVIERGDELR
jgi:hypothetical protein